MQTLAILWTTHRGNMSSFLREFSFSPHLLGTITRTRLDLVLAIPSHRTADLGDPLC